MEARLKQIKREGKLSPYEIVLKKVMPQRVASARLIVPTLSDMRHDRCALYVRLHDWLGERGLEPPESGDGDLL